MTGVPFMCVGTLDC